jgi:hypothetical protein
VRLTNLRGRVKPSLGQDPFFCVEVLDARIALSKGKWQLLTGMFGCVRILRQFLGLLCKRALLVTSSGAFFLLVS